jgi:hypothetical protein
MVRERLSPLMQKRRAYYAGTWHYHAVLKEAVKSTARREYQVPGPGITKEEACEAIRAAERELGREPMADITVRTYARQYAYLRLLDRAGNSQRTRYYPPGYLKLRRQMTLQEGGRYLAELLAGPMEEAQDE